MFTAPDACDTGLHHLVLRIMSIQAVNKAVEHPINSYDQEKERERERERESEREKKKKKIITTMMMMTTYDICKLQFR